MTFSHFASALTRWWQRNTAREQMWLLVGTLVVVLYLGWVAVVHPLLDARDLSQRRLAEARQSVIAVRTLAQELLEARGQQQVSTAGGTLAQYLDDTAGSADLRVSTLEPSTDGRSVAIRMEQVAMASLLQWLAALESDGRAHVDSLTVVPSADAQLSVNLSVSGI